MPEILLPPPDVATRIEMPAPVISPDIMKSAGRTVLNGLSITLAEADVATTHIPEFKWGNPGTLALTGSGEAYQQATADKMYDQGYPQESLDLLMTGKARGKDIDLMNVNLNRNSSNILGVRKSLAELIARQPETANILIDNEIVGFHGTRSSALEDMLSQGALLSAAEAKRRGINHLTGEHLFQRPEGQGSISFTTLENLDNALHYAGSDTQEMTLDEVIARLEQEVTESTEYANSDSLNDRIKGVMSVRAKEASEAINYITENPDSLLAELLKGNFPVLVGVSIDEVYTGHENRSEFWSPVHGTSSGYNEFRVAGEAIDLDKTVIAVPTDKVDRIKQLLEIFGKSGTKVIEIEKLDKKK